MPTRPWEVALVAFEIARRHRFAARHGLAAGDGDGARAARPATRCRPAGVAALPRHPLGRPPRRAGARRDGGLPGAAASAPCGLPLPPRWVRRPVSLRGRARPGVHRDAAAAARARRAVALSVVLPGRWRVLRLLGFVLVYLARRDRRSGWSLSCCGWRPGCGWWLRAGRGPCGRTTPSCGCVLVVGRRQRPAAVRAAGRRRRGRLVAARRRRAGLGERDARAVAPRRSRRLAAARAHAARSATTPAGRASCSRTCCSSTRWSTSTSTACRTPSSRRAPTTAPRASAGWPRGLGDEDALLLFPEGGNFSERPPAPGDRPAAR